MITKEQLKVGIIFEVVIQKQWAVYQVIAIHESRIIPTKIIPLYCSLNINPGSFYCEIINRPYMNIIDENKLKYYEKLAIFK